MSKVSKVAKIRNRYNQVPHLTQDTNGKVTNSQKTPQTRAKRSALSVTSVIISEFNIMDEAREKKYLEISLSKILKFRPYRRLLFCIYILFSLDEITLEEI